MLKKRLAVIIVLCSLLIVTACEVEIGEKPLIEKTIETARTEIWREIGQGNVSSASIAVMKNGEILYQEGFAMADRLSSSPVDENTQYNIGSVSKVFTATAILQLVEEGKVELDQAVSDYLDDFTMEDERYKNITVRMLLNHSSGLPGTYLPNGFATERDSEYLDNFMDYLKRSSLKSDPGKISVYCNDGFTLAEVLVERVSGLSFSEYLEKNIFSTAGMANSSSNFIEDETNSALNYGKNGLANPPEYVNLMGTGGITSTASDLCRFGDALLKDKLITEASFLEGASPQYAQETVPRGTPITNYGLGWDMVEVAEFALKDVKVISKNGATLQFSSQFYLLPEEDLSIALIFAGGGNVTGVTNAIITAFLEENQLIEELPEIASRSMASMPAEVADFAGYYGSGESIIKIEFEPIQNQMIYMKYDGSDFVETNRFLYMDDGFFQNDGGIRYSFNQEWGKKLLLGNLLQGDYSIVLGEEITPGSFLETNAFDDKWWIPINLSAIDLYTEAINTRLVSDIPGMVAVGAEGNYIAYQLKDGYQTEMILEYARDQATGRISTDAGVEILDMGGYRYKELSKIPKMKDSESIEVDSNNSLRFLDYEGSISLEAVEDSRVLVFGPDYTILYDSLIEESPSIDVTPGSILSLIGQPGTVFKVNYDF